MATGQISAVQRFCRLPTPSYEKIYADANNILDEIISQCHTFRRPNQDVNLEEMVAFLSHGCKTLQNASILLKSKFAQVVNIYLPLMKSTIDENCVNQLVSFLCQSLTSVKSSLVSEFMKALALTLTGTGAFLNEDSIVQLLGEDGVIWMYLAQVDWILRSYAIQCLGNMCLRSQHVGILAKENIQLCYSKLLDTLRMFVFEDSKELEHFKLINVTLKAIQKILSGITMHDNIVEPEFAVLLLKIFLVYGLPGYVGIVGRLRVVLPSRKSDDLETMERIYPTKKKEKSTMTKKVNAKKGRKKKKKNLNNSLQEAYDSVAEADQSGYGIMGNWRQMQNQSSSESEFSDSEMNITDQINSLTFKIRLNCAITLQEILRCCDRRSRFACWSVLLPDVLSPENPSLLLSFVTESSPKMKITLLMAIMELADGSRGFLDSVITSPNSSSNFATRGRPFTPFSVKISQSLHLLHDEFMSAIRNCSSDDMKEKMIKCLTLIMLNTPYRKLHKNYLPSILKLVVNSLNCKEHGLCQAVLTCIAACISIQPDNTQVHQIISSTQPPTTPFSMTPSKEKPIMFTPTKVERTNTPLSTPSSVHSPLVTPKDRSNSRLEQDAIEELKSGEKSWLVTYCIRNLYFATKDNTFEMRLSSEYIQLLTVILRCHPHLLPEQQIEKLINFTINVFMFSTDVLISYHGIKLLEEFSKYYNTLYQKTGQDTQGGRFWKRMLSGAIPQYLHVEPTKPVKGQAAICDWISNIGSHMFEIMKNPEQIFVKTVLIGLTESEEPLIAAAAVRALGVIIDYEVMVDDVWFVVDATTSILKQLNNSGAVSVRLKAAWSLANLCDFIAKNGFLANDYPETMIFSLLQDSTKAALGNEKISPNGVRAIGNLLKAFPKHLFGDEKFETAIQESIVAIIKNIRTGQMKTRWNACYASRYIFENPDFPIGVASWTDDLFSAILEALGDCKNFKVRISAAVALSSLCTRSKYGDKDLFAKIWLETLKALEKSEELTDFTEFKHKENLQEQTIILLLHLLSITRVDDLPTLQKISQPHQEIFIINCRKCLSQFEIGCHGNDGKHLPSSNEKVDVYLDYPVTKELSGEEKQKNSVLERHMLEAKTNLCGISNLDRTSDIITIVQKSLCLDT